MAAVMPAGRLLNGLEVDELRDVAREIEREPRRGQVELRVRTEWKGQTRSRTSVESPGASTCAAFSASIRPCGRATRRSATWPD
jgi:hypothetical protein